jgi:integrase
MESGSQLILPGIIQRGTLAETLDWFLSRSLHTWSDATRGQHEDHARWLWQHFGSGCTLDLITYERLCRYRDAEGPNGRGITYTTIRKRLTTLRMALKEAQRREIIERLPPWPVLPNDALAGTRVASVAEYRALQGEFEGRWRRWVVLAYRSGMRKSDLARARRCDFDLEAGTFLRRSTKTKARYPAEPMPMHQELADMIREWDATESPGPKEPVCGAWTMVVRDLAAACMRLGIVRIGPNDMRRSCESNMVAAGATAEFRSLFFGHSEAIAEKHYVRVTPQLLAGGAEALRRVA